MYYNGLHLLALAGLAAANSAPSPQTFTDTFEDKPPQTVNAGVPMPIGIENGLFYNGFAIGTSINGVGNGIIPKSQPNVAAGGFVQNVNGTTTITVDYSGSKVKSFDLLELYYGCSVNTASNVGAAQSCLISVTGFYVDGSRFSTQGIPFGFPFAATSATGVLAQPMQRYIFLPLLRIKSATFAFVATGNDAVAASFFQFDNVKHTNYYS